MRAFHIIYSSNTQNTLIYLTRGSKIQADVMKSM